MDIFLSVLSVTAIFSFPIVVIVKGMQLLFWKSHAPLLHERGFWLAIVALWMQSITSVAALYGTYGNFPIVTFPLVISLFIMVPTTKWRSVQYTLVGILAIGSALIVGSIDDRPWEFFLALSSSLGPGILLWFISLTSEQDITIWTMLAGTLINVIVLILFLRQLHRLSSLFLRMLIGILLFVGLAAYLLLFLGSLNREQPSYARSAQRRSDVNTILNAIEAYEKETGTTMAIPEQTTPICQADTASCEGLVDVKVLVGNYFVSIPRDPQDDLETPETGYLISRNPQTNKITVTAPMNLTDESSDDSTISITH